jgi:hypothetical protein
MGMLSIGVVIYQVIIAAIIIFAASKGKKCLVLVLVLTALWTLTHVFYKPLMLVQFCTIIGSGLYGYNKSMGKSAAKS